MEIENINSSNFDRNLKKLLKIKEGRNIANGRLCLESIKLKDKAELVILLISSLKSIISITYKILFWEEDIKIEKFLELNFPNKRYEKVLSYKNGKRAGVIFIDDRILDESFLKSVLDNHFNFEMAKEPSQNLRVQICVNLNNIIMLLDIYDDRGFDIYYVPLH
ncbi:hypothetical protein [Butyricimonas synergistica]|uniref:hypothetical protein n=1 Tax=Butyricimonas synergistica TaxID=544644 RepID=UPI0003735584|nr:hypothetical protein [Butyricimonas synergistica]